MKKASTAVYMAAANTQSNMYGWSWRRRMGVYIGGTPLFFVFCAGQEGECCAVPHADAGCQEAAAAPVRVQVGA